MTEVQRLREQIEEEVTAMQRGFIGLAAVAKHEYISARAQRLGAYIDELAKHVGVEQANHISCQAYIQATDGVS